MREQIRDAPLQPLDAGGNAHRYLAMCTRLWNSVIRRRSR
jgi:hypothetical protein